MNLMLMRILPMAERSMDLERVRRIISFFQRVQRHFYDKSGRPVGKRPTEEQLRAIWDEPETPIDPSFLDSVPQSYTTIMVLPKQTAH